MANKHDSESEYEVVSASSGAKPGGVVSVRLKPDEMELLVALSEVGGRTLSETLRLGLRCLGDKPAQVAGPSVLGLRLDTHTSEAVSPLPGQPQERSESALTRVTLVLT
jgi:hypothetical protein